MDDFLTDEAKQEAEQLLSMFTEKMQGIAEEIIGDVYVKLMPYIDTDTWSNVRNQFIDDLRHYPQLCNHHAYDIKAIRRKMLDEYRDEIVNDIITDLQDENKRLNNRITELQQDLTRMFYR